MTQLSGAQIGDLVEALLHAYPSEADLAMMVRIELDQTLAAIAMGSNLRVITFNLVAWAERSGAVDELVTGAVKQTPRNPALKAYQKRWPTVAALTLSPPAPSATTGPAAIDVFLSYSRQNLDDMRTVEAGLRDAGLSVWTDEGLEAGTPSWTAAIEEAVGQAQVMVVLLSPAAKGSVWVENEVALAQTLGKRIFPILVDGDARNAVPFRLIGVQWVDGRQALGQAVGQVLAVVVRQLGQYSVISADDEKPAQAKSVDKIVQRQPRPVHPVPELPQTPIEFDWVLIPAGEFLMGSDRLKDSGAYNEEMPQHKLYLPEYRIARVPVTGGQFAQFVKVTKYRTLAEQEGFGAVWTGTQWRNVKGADWSHPSGPQNHVQQKDEHPVVQVSWFDALAFCQWAGVRLPSEAEWEKAARGADGRIWPWGNNEPSDNLCNFNRHVGDTTPVGKYPDGASPYGCLDMAGNTWEWTISLWGNDATRPKYVYPYDSTDGREAMDASDDVLRVLRGGSWLDQARGVRCAFQFRDHPNYWDADHGFRVCV